MKLKKANPSSIQYPTKENIKPIVLSLSVAMALSGCGSQPEIETPSHLAGGMAGPLIGQYSATPSKPFIKAEKNKNMLQKEPEIQEPEVLGGVIPLPNDLPK